MIIGNVNPGTSYVQCVFKQYQVQAPAEVVNVLLETLSNRNLLVKKLLEKLGTEEVFIPVMLTHHSCMLTHLRSGQ